MYRNYTLPSFSNSHLYKYFSFLSLQKLTILKSNQVYVCGEKNSKPGILKFCGVKDPFKFQRLSLAQIYLLNIFHLLKYYAHYSNV